MLPSYFAIIGAVIASLGGVYYLYETLIGKTKPNRVSWLLWGLLPLITFAAQRMQGVEELSWASLVAGVTPLLVVGASYFNKKAYWKTQPLDYVLMCIAFVGVVLWAFTKDANIAILCTIFADLAAGLPTIIKSWRFPDTESWRAYAISAVGFLLCILSIHSFDFQTSAFVIYLFVNELLLALFCIRKRRGV